MGQGRQDTIVIKNHTDPAITKHLAMGFTYSASNRDPEKLKIIRPG
jgi:hypothetical protein